MTTSGTPATCAGIAGVEDGGRIDGGGAGDVEADPGEWPDELSKSSAGEGSGGVLKLQLVIATDSVGSVLEGGDEVRRRLRCGPARTLAR